MAFASWPCDLPIKNTGFQALTRDGFARDT
jgi:hypothetical protein